MPAVLQTEKQCKEISLCRADTILPAALRAHSQLCQLLCLQNEEAMIAILNTNSHLPLMAVLGFETLESCM